MPAEWGCTGLRQLWRSGFGRDLALVIVITIVVGSLIAGGLSVAVDRYFTSSVNHLVGEYGEYDLIVHAHEEPHEAFFATLSSMIDKHIPGARLKRGRTVAGKANFLLEVDYQH